MKCSYFLGYAIIQLPDLAKRMADCFKKRVGNKVDGSDLNNLKIEKDLLHKRKSQSVALIDSGFIRKEDSTNNTRSTNKDKDDITSSKNYEELHSKINELQCNMRSMTNKFQSEIDLCRNQITALKK